MKKIAANRNYKIVQANPVVDFAKRLYPEFKSDENPCANHEKNIDQLGAVIQGLKSFLTDKGFNPRDYTPSGGWDNYQPGSQEPNVSSEAGLRERK